VDDTRWYSLVYTLCSLVDDVVLVDESRTGVD
jgi:hypothetical protein